MPAGLQLEPADRHRLIVIPRACSCNRGCADTILNRYLHDIAGSGVVTSVTGDHVVRSGAGQVEGPNRIVICASPVAEILILQFEDQAWSVPGACGSKQLDLPLGVGTDDWGNSSGRFPRRTSSRGDVAYDVEKILRGKHLFQSFGHQRLAGAAKLIDVGAQNDL